MPESLPARFVLGALVVSLLAVSGFAQAPQSVPTQPPAQAKKAPVGPVALQSTHHPILLLAQGALQSPVSGASTTLAPVQASDPPWSLRVGQNGPERLDRAGYPPIPLEPVDVVREGTTDSWIYRAKDTQTGATVKIRITREACSDPASTTKFVFSASLEHSQIGSMEGCARVAAELFPKISNQSKDEDDDEDPKDKTPPPTVTHFKQPTAVAYINASSKMIVKRGATAHAVVGKAGYSLSLSHDGKKLLFTRDQEPSPLRTIDEYDFSAGTSKELVRANAYEAFWSPDDAKIAFLENTENKWQVWTMPADAPEKAAPLYPGEAVSLQGWADAHTILAGDLQTLAWVGDDGVLKQTLSSAELYGKDQFRLSSANRVRVHPLNPDLLLVSAELLQPPAPASAKDVAATTAGQAIFLYEIKSKRRVILSPSNLSASDAEWSRDGLQIFFTGRDVASGATAIYKMFWDGTSLTKSQDGRNLVIGE